MSFSGDGWVSGGLLSSEEDYEHSVLNIVEKTEVSYLIHFIGGRLSKKSLVVERLREIIFVFEDCLNAVTQQGRQD